MSLHDEPRRDFSSSSPTRATNEMSSRAASASSHSIKHIEHGNLPESSEIASVHTQHEEPDTQAADLEKVASEKPSVHHPSQFPDGGAQAWTVVAGSFACFFVSFGWVNAIGVFQAYYETELLKQYSPSDIAWITSLETFFMFAGGPFVGLMYDHYGPRWPLIIGTFLHVFGLMMASLSSEYYQLLLSQGICSPIGASMVFYPCLSAVLTWFFKRRALALGITASGSSLGGVIWPIMVQRLIPLIGYGWTLRVCAFVILALLIFANLTIRSRIPPHPHPFHILDFVRPLYSLPFALFGLGGFCISFGVFQPFAFVELSALSLGTDPNLAIYIISILNAFSIPGRILPGYIGDKVGRFNVQIVTSYLCGILILALWLPARSDVPVLIFAALYGFSSGAFVAIIPAIIGQLVDIRKIGVSTGALYTCIAFGALIGNPVAGQVLSRDDGNYTYLQILSGVFICVGTTLTVISKATTGNLFKKF